MSTRDYPVQLAAVVSVDDEGDVSIETDTSSIAPAMRAAWAAKAGFLGRVNMGQLTADSHAVESFLRAHAS